MNVVFSHGSKSHPWGKKITALAKIAKEKNHQVDSIDYQDLTDPDERVDRLLAHPIICNQSSSNTVLVGSSMGGYVCAAAAEKINFKGIFLLAPAIHIKGLGIRQQNLISKSNKISIIHGFEDEVIPYQNSISYAQQNRATLHLLSSDHRLTSALAEIENIFANFLDSLS